MPFPPISLAKTKMVDYTQCAQEHGVTGSITVGEKSDTTFLQGKSYRHLKCTTVEFLLCLSVVSMRMWVQSLTSLSGLRIGGGRELCRLQLQLGSGVAVTVV